METSLETILSTLYKDEMVAYVDSHQDIFTDLIELATSENQALAPRAAWLLSNCTKDNDPRIRAYIPQIIKVLPKVNDGQKRDLINVLRKMEIDEDHEGLVFDICVELWSSLGKMPSVRFNAMRLIIHIAEKHPELNSEIALLIQDYYLEPLSLGVQRSIKKLIKKHRIGNSNENEI